MARKKIETITCDRCDKTYEEVGDGEQAPDRTKLVLESFAGHLSFEDLCDRCTKRVTDLVGQLRMVAKDKKESVKETEKKAAADKKSEKDRPASSGKENNGAAKTTGDFA